jgi:hypothetical protein
MSTHVVDRRILEEIAAQIDSEVMDDSDRYVNRFTVKSTSSSKQYVVSQQRSDGMWCCSCTGWTHWRKCKHLTDLLRRLSKVQVRIDEAAAKFLASARTAYLDLEPAAAVRRPRVSSPQLDL